ncbi:unnamed protein product [Clavelina lepadiformis]|uniref:Lysine-specific histone demethylase 1B n=1 Tax=Clavelina lepadiformis TaxID=159417 RepID=A0ABP0GZ64_CLALP
MLQADENDVYVANELQNKTLIHSNITNGNSAGITNRKRKLSDTEEMDEKISRKEDMLADDISEEKPNTLIESNLPSCINYDIQNSNELNAVQDRKECSSPATNLSLETNSTVTDEGKLTQNKIPETSATLSNTKKLTDAIAGNSEESAAKSCTAAEEIEAQEKTVVIDSNVKNDHEHVNESPNATQLIKSEDNSLMNVSSVESNNESILKSLPCIEENNAVDRGEVTYNSNSTASVTPRISKRIRNVAYNREAAFQYTPLVSKKKKELNESKPKTSKPQTAAKVKTMHDMSKRSTLSNKLDVVMHRHTCKKSGCGKKNLNCNIKVTKSCMEASGKSSRWYHISLEEHYCNGCFEEFYRVNKSGCDSYHEWKRAWMQNSKGDANFKNIHTFIAETQLPYWLQCRYCGHWRPLTNEVDLTPELVRTYSCNMGNLANTIEDSSDSDGRRTPHVKYSCLEPHDLSVETVLNSSYHWMEMLSYTPFIKHSPAGPFLTGYYPDGVGMSAVDTTDVRQLSEFTCDARNSDVALPKTLLNHLNVKKKCGKSNDKKKEVKKTSCAVGHSTMLTSPGTRKRPYKDPPLPVEGLNPYFQPFYKPHERGKALCMRPDVMEVDEASAFPHYFKNQTVYLAIRNLIISLWTLNPCQFLTVEKCIEHLLLRGLTRIRFCVVDIPDILQFVTCKGIVNSGAISLPKELSGNGSRRGCLPEEYRNQKVIVIGAGPAGLAAARQLHNFGCDVICLEARDRIGGRVHDDWSLNGVCVGRGAQIINGCVNNPLALISHQLGLKLHTLQPRCDLFAGPTDPAMKRRSSPIKAVSTYCDKRMDFHFNAMLDIIVEWRQAQPDDALDCSLGEKILEAHLEWMNQSGLTFTKLEERLLQFHIGNLEFACGASLDKVSAFHWDQNEIFAQFNGDHAFVPYGFGVPLAALAQDLDIRFNAPVRKIKYDKKQVEVTTKGGKMYTADRVIVTAPLAVLRSDLIRFYPSLPASKKDAMKRLGCGCIEKIGLQFSHRFWDKKIDGANYFGYVPSTPDRKGFFTVFYDIPYPQCEKSNVLMSVISGEAVEIARTMKEKDIINIALSILRDIFPEQAVPEPVNYFVTRWRDDEYAQMAYSFVKCGSSGEDYDELAKEIDNKLFFAGEATNRHFPQTVTGAYLSGLREAAKVVSANMETNCKLKQVKTK